jgi:hypothetical protein
MICLLKSNFSDLFTLDLNVCGFIGYIITTLCLWFFVNLALGFSNIAKFALSSPKQLLVESL